MKQPNAKPEAPRRNADNPVEKQQYRRANQHCKPQRFALVAQPAAPSLHADAEMAARHVTGHVQWQARQGQNHQKHRKEEQSL